MYDYRLTHFHEHSVFYDKIKYEHSERYNNKYNLYQVESGLSR